MKTEDVVAMAVSDNWAEGGARTTYVTEEMHYDELVITARGRYVWIDSTIDLQTDYDYPRPHRAEYARDNTGGRTGRYCRIMIDHDATGTRTAGMGDTIVRIV